MPSKNYTKGKLITHYQWCDINEQYYIKLKNYIPIMYVVGDNFRENIKGKNNLFVTMNPFKIFKLKEILSNNYMEFISSEKIKK